MAVRNCCSGGAKGRGRAAGLSSKHPIEVGGASNLAQSAVVVMLSVVHWRKGACLRERGDRADRQATDGIRRLVVRENALGLNRDQGT
jgi:hypothetical protein